MNEFQLVPEFGVVPNSNSSSFWNVFLAVLVILGTGMILYHFFMPKKSEPEEQRNQKITPPHSLNLS